LSLLQPASNARPKRAELSAAATRRVGLSTIRGYGLRATLK
jgi:hypothetical protein